MIKYNYDANPTVLNSAVKLVSHKTEPCPNHSSIAKPAPTQFDSPTMKPVPALISLFLVLFTLTGCQTSREVAPQAPFAERYEAAMAREKTLFDSGVTANMRQGTQNVIDEFFPEAAAKVADQYNMPLSEAETLLQLRMAEASKRVNDDCIEKNGYGTIVGILSAQAELSVIRDIIESPLAETSAEPDAWLYWEPARLGHYGIPLIILAGYDPIYIDDVIIHASRGTVETPLLTPQSLTHEDASKWEKGHELAIAYSSARGAVIVDPSTDKYIEIIRGLKEHPLEKLNEAKEAEGSTRYVEVGANEMVKLWQLEIDRIYDRLRLEFPEKRRAFDQAQKKWKAHTMADLEALGASFDQEGLIYSLTAAKARVNLYKSHALRLAKLGRH